MIGLICWTRSFTYNKDGSIIYNADGPVFAAHPQPNMWDLLISESKTLAGSFDLIQTPPLFNGSGEGYAFFNSRNYNSNWGTEAELIAAIQAMYAAGLRISPDLTYRQMNGENGGPGVFNYPGGVGDMDPTKFQAFPPLTSPPFVGYDDVPDPSGNYAFGRVISYQLCKPAGWTEANTISALADCMEKLGFILWATEPRWDDGKGMHAPSVLRMMNSQKDLAFFVEFDSGNTGEVDWYVMTLMRGRCAVEDYPQYWHTQDACNMYDANQFDAGDGGYYQLHGGKYAIGFTSNPDVATSWSPTGGISQQIAFNKLLGIAHDICLPFQKYMVYSEDYFPASPNYPTGRGLQPFIDNLCWFSRTFAFGNYERRWIDHDVKAYTRDGNGGAVGWSGGCLVVVNFNTIDARTITVQTTWAEGTWVHNYSATGHNEDYTVAAGGKLTVTVKSNYFSGGQSYLLIAPGGVNHPVKMHPITA